jgi:mycothiol system anti-sigma-R factor
MSCGNPHDTDCSDVLDRIYEFLDGEMTPSDVDSIKHHLLECSPCLDSYELDRMVQALVRRSCACEAAPDQLKARIKVAVSQVLITYRSDEPR